MATPIDELLSGSNIFADHMLRCYDDGGVLRLAVLAAMMNSILYIHHKDVSYRTLIWDGVRGKVEVGENMLLLADVLLSKTRCGDAGNSATVRRAFTHAGDEGITSVAKDVCGVLRKAAVTFRKKNFCATLDMEGTLQLDQTYCAPYAFQGTEIIYNRTRALYC